VTLETAMPVLFDLGDSAYLWVKWLHVLSIITWMAGLFYLPRLYVYHAMTDLSTAAGQAQSETFKIMERRLLKGITTPSLVIVLVTGLAIAPNWLNHGWLHVKILLVLGMIGCHILYARWRVDFLNDANTRSHKVYRLWNEVPTLLLLGIIAMVVVKPF
jgi:putative membrane protein